MKRLCDYKSIVQSFDEIIKTWSLFVECGADFPVFGFSGNHEHLVVHASLKHGSFTCIFILLFNFFSYGFIVIEFALML